MTLVWSSSQETLALIVVMVLLVSGGGTSGVCCSIGRGACGSCLEISWPLMVGMSTVGSVSMCCSRVSVSGLVLEKMMVLPRVLAQVPGHAHFLLWYGYAQAVNSMLRQ